MQPLNSKLFVTKNVLKQQHSDDLGVTTVLVNPVVQEICGGEQLKLQNATSPPENLDNDPIISKKPSLIISRARRLLLTPLKLSKNPHKNRVLKPVQQASLERNQPP
jgi:hypothetical protein